MRFIDITIVKPGTDVEAVESLLLELFERYERVEVFVVEKIVQARAGSSHAAYRYRVHVKNMDGYPRLLGNLTERLRVRTNSAIRITDPYSDERYSALDNRSRTL